MNEGHTVDVIYLDFDKAFNSVGHKLFSVKMKSIGLGDVVVQ